MYFYSSAFSTNLLLQYLVSKRMHVYKQKLLKIIFFQINLKKNMDLRERKGPDNKENVSAKAIRMRK
jgi:hypothetical protein